MAQPDEYPHILLIDDDGELGQMLSDYLAADQLRVTVCQSGESGLEQLARESFDLIILDVMLPGMNGLDVLRRLRPDNLIPVIMLTARGDDVDRIIGLEVGADDYLPKPFNPRELSARVRAILRRSQTLAPAAQQAGLTLAGLEMDPKARRVLLDDQALQLTGTEFEILRCLMETPGEVVTKDSLSERALGRRLLPFDRSVDTHISNLRQKLGADARITISNQRGVGYLLLADPS